MDKLMPYSQFVGRWEAEAQAFLPDGSVRRHYWQIRFERALDRAIQDVWITPPRDGPNVGAKLVGRLQGGAISRKAPAPTARTCAGSSAISRPLHFAGRAELSRDGGSTWFKAIQLLAKRTQEP